MIETIIFFVVIIILWIALFKLIKSIFIFKAVFRLLSIFLVLFIIVAVISALAVLRDADNFRKNFSNSTNLFVLESNRTFYSGVEINGNNPKTFNALANDKLLDIQQKYYTGRTDDIKKAYYKMFIINIKALDDMPDYSVTDQNINLNKSQSEALLLSSTPKKDLADSIAARQNLPPDQVFNSLNGDDASIKGYLFSYSLNYYFNPTNLDSFMLELKNQNIQVFEDTAMFKAIRMVPKIFVKDMIKNPNANNSLEQFFNSTLTTLG